MTDIETREAMRASWLDGFSDRKISVSVALAAYANALSAFEAEEVAYASHIDATGQAIGYPGFTAWCAARAGLETARNAMMAAQNELNNFFARMEDA
jgi:hypothetical protein